MNTKFRKSIALICLLSVFSISFLPIFSRKAEAQWAVWDIPGALKDMGLDAIAWEVVNRVINRMAASTVQWINSGFQGSPMYVTNPESYFLDIGDQLAGQYILSDPDLQFLCGPLQAKVRIALARSYLGEDQRWNCTVTDVIDNIDDFMDNFERGGWEGFMKISQESQNNPLGAYMQAEGALSRELSKAIGTKKEELSWGSGFLSKKECVEWDEADPAELAELEALDPGTSYEGTRVCIREETVTPGETISNQLNDVLGIGNNKLAVADEINEIVSALLNQLVNKIVGGMGSLLGASRPDPTEKNTQSLRDLLASSTETVDYFGNKQDTTITNQPIPDDSTLVWPSSPTGPTGGTSGGDNQDSPFQNP